MALLRRRAARPSCAPLAPDNSGGPARTFKETRPRRSSSGSIAARNQPQHMWSVRRIPWIPARGSPAECSTLPVSTPTAPARRPTGPPSSGRSPLTESRGRSDSHSLPSSACAVHPAPHHRAPLSEALDDQRQHQRRHSLKITPLGHCSSLSVNSRHVLLATTPDHTAPRRPRASSGTAPRCGAPGPTMSRVGTDCRELTQMLGSELRSVTPSWSV